MFVAVEPSVLPAAVCEWEPELFMDGGVSDGSPLTLNLDTVKYCVDGLACV